MIALSIGFTGTRHGMTAAQSNAVSALVAELVRSITGTLSPLEAHHGDCIGADAEFHAIVALHGAFIVVHPGPADDRERQAGCIGAERREPLPHMRRNRNIVQSSTVMIAAPQELADPGYGGTWRTIRMALRARRPLAVCYRDGSVVKERW